MLTIRDPHLELRLKRQMRARQHKTLARTARELLAERLFDLELLDDRPRRAKAKTKSLPTSHADPGGG